MEEEYELEAMDEEEDAAREGGSFTRVQRIKELEYGPGFAPAGY